MFAPRQGPQTRVSPAARALDSDAAPVVLGIDPGLTRCGYAVVREGAQPELVSLGVLSTPAGDDLPSRLAGLQRDLVALFDEFSPAAVAVERVFFQHNTRTAMSVGQASGIVLALAASRGCEVAQYTPTQVKNSVAGWGSADKSAVARMVQMRFGLRTEPKPADAADAAALALCHIAAQPFARSVARTRGVS
ncbi:MAG: crossover junction endodeoxyribonuclease RuvC [Actinomycetota bacterium]|jgi:crossover junction endodeoxyribonuclease RuvC